MFARASTYEVPANHVQSVAGIFGEAISHICEMAGFSGAYVLVNAENGRTMTLTLWDSRTTMEASRVTASRLRSDAARGVDSAPLSTEE
jgi:heme-degrading monooxygenase HmoA